MAKITGEGNVRKDRFISGPELRRDIAHHSWKVWWRAQEATDHLVSTVRNRERGQDLELDYETSRPTTSDSLPWKRLHPPPEVFNPAPPRDQVLSDREAYRRHFTLKPQQRCAQNDNNDLA